MILLLILQIAFIHCLWFIVMFTCTSLSLSKSLSKVCRVGYRKICVLFFSLIYFLFWLEFFAVSLMFFLIKTLYKRESFYLTTVWCIGCKGIYIVPVHGVLIFLYLQAVKGGRSVLVHSLIFYLYLQAVKGGDSVLVHCFNIFYLYLQAVKGGGSVLVHSLIFYLYLQAI